MIKVILFIKKIEHISLDDFIHYYEEIHVPLVEKLLPMYAGYKRNYLKEGIYPTDVERKYDVVTELLFFDSEMYNAWLQALEDPVVLTQIRADEENFINSDETIMWVVDEYGK